MDNLIAYLGKPELKTFVLGQLETHRKADKLIKGSYWENGKGCAVGCTIEAVRWFNGKKGRKLNHKDHGLYETELGVPRILARLEDRMFEALDNGASQAWPERFTSAINVGADLTMVWPRFALWLLTEEVPQHTKREKTLASLAEVAALYKEWTEGTKPTAERWEKARRNAAAYAAYAADAYAYAADAYADADADAYAAAAAYAADAAAAAAADAADADADGQKSWIRMSDKLIELLQATK